MSTIADYKRRREERAMDWDEQQKQRGLGGIIKCRRFPDGCPEYYPKSLLNQIKIESRAPRNKPENVFWVVKIPYIYKDRDGEFVPREIDPLEITSVELAESFVDALFNQVNNQNVFDLDLFGRGWAEENLEEIKQKKHGARLNLWPVEV